MKHVLYNAERGQHRCKLQSESAYSFQKFPSVINLLSLKELFIDSQLHEPRRT